MDDSADSHPQFCTSCGTALEADPRFCPECGARVGDDTPMSATPDPVNPPDILPVRRKLVAIVLTGVLLVSVAGAGIYWWLGHQGGCSETYNLMTEGYPVAFEKDVHDQFPNPAQLTYFHLMELAHQTHGGNLSVGSPKLGTDVVEITLSVNGDSTTMSFIELENNGKCARVMVGPVDSEPDGLYVLEKKFSGWVIIGIEPVEYPDPGEDP